MKHSRFIRIRNRKHLSPAHCNELRNPKRCSGKFQFFSGSLTYVNSGMINLYKYIGVNERNAILDMRKAFPDGGGNFQSDNVPCLSSEKVKTIFSKQKYIMC